jgi:hypothetical protein
MGSIFSNIQKTYAEYEFWKALSNEDKVNFLFDMYSVQQHSGKAIDLESFFRSLKDGLEDAEEEPELAHVESYDFDSNALDRVDVMIDDSNIMIESNNLKALRAVTYKFIESGYILQRDVIMEKLFRKDKLTKYLRIFKIINQSTDLCFN